MEGQVLAVGRDGGAGISSGQEWRGRYWQRAGMEGQILAVGRD